MTGTQSENTPNGDLKTRLDIPREVLARLAISENGFVFDPASGNSYMCNETALLLLRALQQCDNTAEVMTEVKRQYDVPDRDLERDLLEFTGQLREYLGI